MKVLSFFSSMLAMSVVFSLWRLPHLVLENGGGVFFIVFFIMLHLVSLPLILGEITMGKLLTDLSLKKVYAFKKAEGFSSFRYQSLRIFILFQSLMQISAFLFLVFFCSQSLLFMSYYLLSTLGFIAWVDSPLYEPEPWLRVCVMFFVVAAFYGLMKKSKEWSLKSVFYWLLPFQFVLLSLIFGKTLHSLTDFEGLRALFYPDFSQVTARVFIRALGHGLICLFVSLGLYRSSVLIHKRVDPVNLSINIVIQALLCSLVVGIMAVPMLSQVNETHLASDWIFDILPRWLSYGEFGSYYIFLFFLSLSILSGYLVLLTGTLYLKGSREFSLKPETYSLEKMSAFGIFSLALLSLLFFNDPFYTLPGRHIQMALESLFFDFLLPLLSLVFIWFLFFFTDKAQREETFLRQKIFFHNRYFYRFWEFAMKFVIPTVIILGWYSLL